MGFYREDRVKNACQAQLSLRIECFHSRGQHLCKFIRTKESVCTGTEFNSHRTRLGHQHGRRFIVLGHQYGRRDVMWKRSIGKEVAVGTYSSQSSIRLLSTNLIPQSPTECKAVRLLAMARAFDCVGQHGLLSQKLKQPPAQSLYTKLVYISAF